MQAKLSVKGGNIKDLHTLSGSLSDLATIAGSWHFRPDVPSQRRNDLFGPSRFAELRGQLVRRLPNRGGWGRRPRRPQVLERTCELLGGDRSGPPPATPEHKDVWRHVLF